MKSGAFVCIDLTRKDSIQEARKIMQELNEKSNSVMATVILANKGDLKHLREVSKEDLDYIKLAYNVKYFEVSAFNGAGLKEAMKHMLEAINKLIEEYGRHP